MDKRKYVAQLHILETLPVPGTRIYPPNDKLIGKRIDRYEIRSDCEIAAVVDSACLGLEIDWTLKQVRQCTWDKTQ